jgi:hypothetical protein
MLLVLGFILLLLLVSWLVSMLFLKGVCGVIGNGVGNGFLCFWVWISLGGRGFGEMVEQRLNAVQKAAWSIYLKASSDNARVGALRAVLDALEVHGSIVQTKEVLERLDRLEEIAEKQQKRVVSGGFH